MKRTIFSIMLALFFGLSITHAGAAPSITSVSGTVSHGQSIMVSGSGFGAKSSAAPWRWDAVDNISAYSGVTDGQTIPAGGGYPWAINENNVIKMETTETMRHSNGSKMYKGYWPGGREGGPKFDNTVISPGTGTIYAGWWFKWNGFNLQNNPGNHSSKFIRLSDSSDPVNKTFSWTQMNEYVYINGCYGNGVDEIYYPIAADTWAFHEVILNSTTKTVSMYVNGSLISDINFGSCGSIRYDEVWGIGWDAGGAAPPSETIWMDDIYIDNTLARVVIGNASNYSSAKHREMQIPTAWSDTGISVKINAGSFTAGQTVYLYVFNPDGSVNVQGYPIVMGGGTGDSPPNVSITSPTSESNYVASQSAVQITGSGSDDDGVTNVTWSNSRGGSGNAVNDSGTWSSWSTGNIGLLEGENVITVTAMDTANQSSTDTLTVTYYSASGTVQAWSALAQTGDSGWGNSYVTYCARLLVEGSSVTASGSQIQLGFQGRASGSYTIKKVSIAERDTGGLEGDVVDSTWTKVTFNGNSVSTWATDVITVPAGQEKLSNVIPFVLHADKDYYVTFKIESPSVYLDPPSTYRELYFSSADHTGDIDWGQNGHDSILDYHALSGIYVLAGAAVGPAPPPNLRLGNK